MLEFNATNQRLKNGTKTDRAIKTDGAIKGTSC